MTSEGSTVEPVFFSVNAGLFGTQNIPKIKWTCSKSRKCCSNLLRKSSFTFISTPKAKKFCK